MRLKALGYDLNGEQLQALFPIFKRVADEKKRVENEDLQAIHAEWLSLKI
jgi:isopropylmalate/homocitrate/citramalate synthase